MTFAEREGFRYEADMIRPIVEQAPRLVFDPRRSRGVRVFTEVRAVESIPDVVAVRFDEEVVRLRESAGVVPLRSLAEVDVVLLAASREVTVDLIIARFGRSAEHARQVLIPELCAKGWLRRSGADRYELRFGARPASSRIVTVEAKLRDWDRGAWQARAQRWSSDASYLAVPGSAARRAMEDINRLAAAGIGLMTVDDVSGKCVIVRSARIGLPIEQRRRGRLFVGESCLALHQSGETSGETFPVFGWSPPREPSPG